MLHIFGAKTDPICAPALCGHGHQWYDQITLLVRFVRGLIGFDDLAEEVLARLRTEADVDPSLREFVGEMEVLRGKPRERVDVGGDNQVALPIHFRRGTTNLRYFMTLTTLGTPLDMTAQELRIESYFPMDAETEAFGERADE